MSSIKPWIKLSFDATYEAVDWVYTLLASVDYAGKIETTAYSSTQNPDHSSSQWAFHIRLYLPDDRTTQIDKILSLLSPLYRTKLISDPDIAECEKQPTLSATAVAQTHQIGRFVISSTDASEQPNSVNEIQLKVLPSLAFGSGLHPATQLSLQLLEQHVMPEMNILDLGSGTGILSVAAAKLGGRVLALDNDSTAVAATQETVRRNQVESQVTAMAGSLGQGSTMGHWMGGDLTAQVPAVDSSRSFDLIVSNILARIHIALAEDYQQALCHATQSGILITAGYTTDYENEVNTALTSAGFININAKRNDEWVALAYRL